MSGILAIIAAYLFWALYSRFKEWREEKREENSFEELMPDENIEIVNQETTKVTESMGTRNLVFDTLSKMGCQYTIGDDDDSIAFTFQGERFVIYASDDCLMIDIWDYLWEAYELYDIDGLSHLKRAINEANARAAVTTVYTISESRSSVEIHCHQKLLFIPQIPNIEDYLQAMLANFFRVHHFIAAELEKVKEG